KNQAIPRRAGVSSFGFGGTNSHVVLEEAPTTKRSSRRKNTDFPYSLICLSAKTEAGLKAKQKDLLSWLELHPAAALKDIAHTLSSGREHFKFRSVLIVKDTADLTEKLSLTVTNKAVDRHLAGTVERKKKDQKAQLLVELGQMVVSQLEDKSKLSDTEYIEKLTVLAELYTSGHELDFAKPWFGQEGKRIALPTYPFTYKRHWIPESKQIVETNEQLEVQTATIHPLLNSNLSDFATQLFSTMLNGTEFFLKDHLVNGEMILPAVAYLEMVRAAITESTRSLMEQDGVLQLKNILWARPVVVEEGGREIRTSLDIDAAGELSFEVFAEVGGEIVVFCQGSATYRPEESRSSVAVEGIERQPYLHRLTKDHCYQSLTQKGFQYGPGHQALESVWINENRLIAKVKLPGSLSQSQEQFMLHPSMMDAALQAALLKDFDSDQLFLPFAMEAVEILAPCITDMWAVVNFKTQPTNSIRTATIDLCDRSGQVCVKLTGVSFRKFSGPMVASESASAAETEEGKDGILLLSPSWKSVIRDGDQGVGSFDHHVIFLCEMESVTDEQLVSQFPSSRIITLQGAQKNAAQRFQQYARKVFEEVQSLLQSHSSDEILVQIVSPFAAEAQLFAGLSGILKTAQQETPNFSGQLIQVAPSDNVAAVLKANGSDPKTDEIRYFDGIRHIGAWEEIDTLKVSEKTLPLQENGVYLITGGAGGLGVIFARAIIASLKNATLILTGRSPVDTQKTELLESLNNGTVRVDYRSVDVTDKRGLKQFIEGLEEEFDGISGIIHSAGIVRDEFIVKKDKEQVVEVLSSKVLGATFLDEATKDLSLDFVVYCSSIVGPLGNVGQVDYAAANAFLDSHAAYRNELVAQGKRTGHTLSINWPLWQEGGMQLSPEMEKVMLNRLGMNVLTTDAGINALWQSLQLQQTQVMV
ncbi:MAG: SDR family NAD(P)-dependent oxidoreductase, partial [Bacteroidota bacterium]